MGSEIRGRIVVYSIVGCPHCKRAKATLEEHKLPFTDVSLDAYDESVREDVRSRTGRRTVPQIFFNNYHIGGNEELQTLINENKEKFDELVEMVKTQESSEDAPRVPDDNLLIKDGDSEIDFTCELDEYAKLVRELKIGDIIKDHRRFLLSYKKTFTGKSFIDWVGAKKGLDDRAKGIQQGQQLIDKGFCHLVKGKVPGEFHDSEDALYRLFEHEDSAALNAGLVSDCEPRPASELGEHLRKLILLIYNDHLSKDGKGVDYKGIAKSPKFEKYVKASAELTRVELDGASVEEKLAFFINMYNALVIHANVKVGIPTNMWQRYKFFNYSSYIIGGHKYSLQDIENGVLRSNRKAIAAFSRQFWKGDPRLKVALEEPEPLIHFALVCGAKSCPPIKTYSAKGVYEQLKVAAEAFLESDDGCKVDVEKQEVHLSRILKWYKEDFGGTDSAAVDWVMKHVGDSEKKTQMQALVQGGTFKVIYMHYDWSVNSQH